MSYLGLAKQVGARLKIEEQDRMKPSVPAPDSDRVGDPRAPAALDFPGQTLDPRARLWRLLNTWAAMDEAAWTKANVKALYDDIMDLFREYREAEGWYREWRAAHPEARW